MNVLGIHTRYRSIDELVARLHPFCDEISIFITSKSLVATGTESPFAILLADRQIAMQGWCFVFDAWGDAENPYGRPGMRLGLHRLTPQSQLVVERMRASRSVAARRIRMPSLTDPEVRRPLAVKIPAPQATGESPVRKRIASSGIPRVLFDEPTARMSDPLHAMRTATDGERPLIAEGSRPTTQTHVDTDDVGYVIDIPPREIVPPVPPLTPTRRRW